MIYSGDIERAVLQDCGQLTMYRWPKTELFLFLTRVYDDSEKHPIDHLLSGVRYAFLHVASFKYSLHSLVNKTILGYTKNNNLAFHVTRSLTCPPTYWSSLNRKTGQYSRPECGFLLSVICNGIISLVI